MKNFITYTLIFIAALAIAYFSFKPKQKETTYSKTLNTEKYTQSQISKLQDELEVVRIEKLRLQAELDSCRYDDFKEVVYAPKPKKKSTKVKVNCQKQDSLINELNGRVARAIDNEIALTSKVGLRERQIDTLVYALGEYDKALANTSKEAAKFEARGDSLQQVLETPITFESNTPCLKTRKGIKTVASVIPATGKADFKVVSFPLDKKEYKSLKKQCKKVK